MYRCTQIPRIPSARRIYMNAVSCDRMQQGESEKWGSIIFDRSGKLPTINRNNEDLIEHRSSIIVGIFADTWNANSWILTGWKASMKQMWFNNVFYFIFHKQTLEVKESRTFLKTFHEILLTARYHFLGLSVVDKPEMDDLFMGDLRCGLVDINEQFAKE